MNEELRMIRALAYATAFAQEMARAGHGDRVVDTKRTSESTGGAPIMFAIDARARAHRWATTVADAAVEMWRTQA